MLEDYLDRFEFFPQALDEYRDAGIYYEAQQPGLAERFDLDVVSALRQVIEFPESSPIFDTELPQVRKCTTRVFRFQVVYFSDSRSIKIVALAHPLREPGYWAKRIGGTLKSN